MIFAQALTYILALSSPRMLTTISFDDIADLVISARSQFLKARNYSEKNLKHKRHYVSKRSSVGI
jgi:hypothetical protein